MELIELSYAELDADYEDVDCADCGLKFFVDPKAQAENPQTICARCRKDWLRSTSTDSNPTSSLSSASASAELTTLGWPSAPARESQAKTRARR